MTYTVPPKKTDPKPRLVRVTDPAEVEAVQRSALRDPIGIVDSDGTALVEAHSLAQYRKQPVEFVV